MRDSQTAQAPEGCSSREKPFLPWSSLSSADRRFCGNLEHPGELGNALYLSSRESGAQGAQREHPPVQTLSNRLGHADSAILVRDEAPGGYFVPTYEVLLELWQPVLCVLRSIALRVGEEVFRPRISHTIENATALERSKLSWGVGRPGDGASTLYERFYWTAHHILSRPRASLVVESLGCPCFLGAVTLGRQGKP